MQAEGGSEGNTPGCLTKLAAKSHGPCPYSHATCSHHRLRVSRAAQTDEHGADAFAARAPTHLTRRIVDSCVVLPVVPLLSLLMRSICSCWRSDSDLERFMALIAPPAPPSARSARLPPSGKTMGADPRSRALLHRGYPHTVCHSSPCGLAARRTTLRTAPALQVSRLLGKFRRCLALRALPHAPQPAACTNRTRSGPGCGNSPRPSACFPECPLPSRDPSQRTSRAPPPPALWHLSSVPAVFRFLTSLAADAHFPTYTTPRNTDRNTGKRLSPRMVKRSPSRIPIRKICT